MPCPYGAGFGVFHSFTYPCRLYGLPAPQGDGRNMLRLEQALQHIGGEQPVVHGFLQGGGVGDGGWR